ncbi:MAG: S23 ribosomal protein [Parcubacteria group bacterium Gr01-1014_24]|nr:MAG: S23 ribosomal protein [Parcubacteria group bacterium Gr01-1014_24]
MATISKFEDLICFNKARELTKSIYEEFKDCKDYGFKDQITRASVSILSNIAEGFERGTKNEFLNFLYIAKGSAGEVRAQLYVALDAGYLNLETFKYLNNLALECSRLIQSFSEKVKKGASAGTQFKKLEKDDPMKEILRHHAPDVYKRFYGN